MSGPTPHVRAERAATARLLLVEDQASVRRVLAAGLRAAGYEVLEAANGAAAIECARGEPIDLMVLDLGLPDMNGLEAMRALRCSGAPAFICLSARDDPQAVAESVAEGALCYAVKPISPAQLIPLVRAALARAQELKALRDEGRALAEHVAGHNRALQRTNRALRVLTCCNRAIA